MVLFKVFCVPRLRYGARFNDSAQINRKIFRAAALTIAEKERDRETVLNESQSVEQAQQGHEGRPTQYTIVVPYFHIFLVARSIFFRAERARARRLRLLP